MSCLLNPYILAAPASGGGGTDHVSARYFRLDVSNGGTVGLDYIRFVGTDGTVYNATFTASSTIGGYPASNLADSTAGTAWAASGAASIYADLGAVYDIASIDVQARAGYASQAPLSMNVYTSADGSTYTAQSAHLPNAWSNGEYRRFKLVFDAWRIAFLANNTDSFTSIMEAELHTTIGGATVVVPASTVSTVAGDANAIKRGRIGGSTAGYGSVYGAFDGVTTGSSTTNAFYSNAAFPIILDVHFDSTTVIKEFSIHNRNDGYNTQAPKNFSLRRSTDNGLTFTDVVAITNQTAWSNTGETRTFATGL